MKKLSLNFVDIVADIISAMCMICVFIISRGESKPAGGWLSLESVFSIELLILLLCLIAVTLYGEAVEDTNLTLLLRCILTALGCYYVLVSTFQFFSVNVNFDRRMTMYIAIQAFSAMYIGRKAK